MKTRFALMLAAVLMLLSACGQEPPPDTPPSASPTETAQASTPALTESDAPSQSVTPENPEPSESFDPSATIEETVLVDEGDVKITATGIKYAAYEVKLNLTIENNTDQNLSFYAGTLGYCCNSINGYMVDDGYLNTDVGPGKKANESVSFDIDELTMLGITDIADIEIGFDISDDDYNDYLETGPRQVKTSLADSYDYATDTYRRAITDGGVAGQMGFTVVHDSEEIPFDQKGVRVLSQTLVENSSGEPVLLIEVENNSDDMVYASVGHVALNGLSVESGTWSTDWVSAGKRRVMSIPLSSLLDQSYRDIFGLDEIGSVAYSFEIEDSEGDTLVVPPTLTLTVPGNTASYDSSGEEVYLENGIRIVSKGIMPDTSEYSDDIHLLLLVENGSSVELDFNVDYNSVSVNGYMTSFSCYSRTAVPSSAAVLDVELRESSLEENGITSLEDITEVELTFEIKDGNYKTVAEPVVTVTGKLAEQ